MVKQTHFRTEDSSTTRRITVPVGLPRATETVLRAFGLDSFLDAYKEKGVPLSKVVTVMI